MILRSYSFYVETENINAFITPWELESFSSYLATSLILSKLAAWQPNTRQSIVPVVSPYGELMPVTAVVVGVLPLQLVVIPLPLLSVVTEPALWMYVFFNPDVTDFVNCPANGFIYSQVTVMLLDPGILGSLLKIYFLYTYIFNFYFYTHTYVYNVLRLVQTQNIMDTIKRF